MDHTLRFTARTLGPRSRGTDATCQCGWEAYTNEHPPSKSKRWQNAVQEHHAVQATPEWTLTRLREELAGRIAKLQRAAEQGQAWNLDMYGSAVARWADRLAEELKEQQAAAQVAKAKEQAARYGMSVEEWNAPVPLPE